MVTTFARKMLVGVVGRRLLFGGVPTAGWLGELALLLLRVTTGVFMAVGHGWPKAINPGPFIENAVRGKFPMETLSGWFAILGELVGGALLALGLFTRIAAAWVAAVMAGAAFISHAGSFTGEQSFFLGPGARGPVEPALLYLALAVAFMVLGSSRTGIDRVLRK
jgi:putative oxidoreductase